MKIMNFRKNVGVYAIIIGLTVFGGLGWSFAVKNNGDANAESTANVDSDTLDSLYDAVFHRPADTEGRGFHLGRDLKDVLRDFRNSDELRYYGALFKAVKSYEEAQRAPGTLSDEEKKSYLDLIDSSLATLLAWVATLPDQEVCRATVDPEHAREAIKAAYDRMNSTARSNAEHGIFNALKNIGNPANITVFKKCMKPSPSRSTFPSPLPSATTNISPSVTY